jgi:phosphoribosyl-AMP cyclohydrolase / phosphoribosyl-ATP pyrophosphohydrolase
VKLDFSKGLIPAIIVDDVSNDILMLAYMNEEAYKKTVDTNETWFYSRSRKSLWNKGATSGNKQIVKSIEMDCDADTLLVRVDAKGPACHTGERSCFYRSIIIEEYKEQNVRSFEGNIFEKVMSEIEGRKKERVENSYTNYLFEKGIDKIGKKVIEEAGEIVIAAKNQNRQEVINECSDLLYHSFVLLANQNISLNEIETELANRFLKKGNSKGDRPDILKW